MSDHAAELLAAIKREAEQGRAEYAKDERYGRLLRLTEGLSQETFVMMLMDCEDGLAEAARLREALVEMHSLIKTRRTSLHMDGTEMFSQPILAQLNQIARDALGETP